MMPIENDVQTMHRTRIVARMVALLEADEWQVNHAGAAPFFAVPVEGTHARWVLAGRALADGRGLVCYSVLQHRVAAGRRSEIIRHMNAVNSELSYGSFELTAEGEVRFRTGIRLGEAAIDDALLREVFYRNLEVMDHHLAELSTLGHA